jgi:excisionase family DNA binding protein
MSQDLHSVEEVAKLLNLHVRTVRGYVREGRLKAVRIGKQYRIAREDLVALTGRPAASFDPEPVRRQRHVDVSSIVEIDAISQEQAMRLMTTLTSAPKSRAGGDDPLHVETIYNEERARMKVIVAGSIGTVSSFLGLISFYLESSK